MEQAALFKIIRAMFPESGELACKLIELGASLNSEQLDFVTKYLAADYPPIFSFAGAAKHFFNAPNKQLILDNIPAAIQVCDCKDNRVVGCYAARPQNNVLTLAYAAEDKARFTLENAPAFKALREIVSYHSGPGLELNRKNLSKYNPYDPLKYSHGSGISARDSILEHYEIDSFKILLNHPKLSTLLKAPSDVKTICSVVEGSEFCKTMVLLILEGKNAELLLANSEKVANLASGPSFQAYEIMGLEKINILAHSEDARLILEKEKKLLSSEQEGRISMFSPIKENIILSKIFEDLSTEASAPGEHHQKAIKDERAKKSAGKRVK